MKINEPQDSPALEEAGQLFSHEGIPFPFIPPEMRLAFAELSEWVYGTRPDAPWLYEIRKYVKEAATIRMADYLLLGHAGHGIQSYAMHYYVVRGPLALFLQIAWGGVYMDKDEAARNMEVRYTQAEEIIRAVEVSQRKNLFRPEERLIISASDFYGSSWTWIDSVLDEDSFNRSTWHKDEDVLSAALNELQSRLPGTS